MLLITLAKVATRIRGVRHECGTGYATEARPGTALDSTVLDSTAPDSGRAPYNVVRTEEGL
ncbi:hypothetical protein GCM10010411_45880 [Actinomadura fulvescens]|uniref:Uncharacterized protein n=1 Tax=Actinomadura fulvescens TaxID=46160 RepID=A0ABP6CBA3_9ACTN